MRHIDALALFRLGNFRCLASGVLLSSVGNMGELVALGWLALELTDSPFLVGLAMGARALPLFFVGVPAGVLADRFPRHRLLMLTSAGQALTASAVGVLALLGRVRLAHLILLAIVAGALRAVEHAARQSYTHDVVGGAALVNGLSILGVALRVGWLAGSLGAGAVIARHGVGAAFLAAGACYLAGAGALLPATAVAHGPARTTGSVWTSMLGFVTALRQHRMLLVLMVLTAGAEVLGFSHQALLPSLARDVLHAGPEGLGALNAARSLGGILGLVAAATLRPAGDGGGPLFLAILLIFGVGVLGLGVAPWLVGFAGVVAVLVVANAAGALADLLAQSLLQLSAPAHLRGQAGGAWVVAIGLAPLGQLQIGALASLFGVSLALGASGVALVALAGGVALRFPGLRRL